MRIISLLSWYQSKSEFEESIDSSQLSNLTHHFLFDLFDFLYSVMGLYLNI